MVKNQIIYKFISETCDSISHKTSADSKFISTHSWVKNTFCIDTLIVSFVVLTFILTSLYEYVECMEQLINIYREKVGLARPQFEVVLARYCRVGKWTHINLSPEDEDGGFVPSKAGERGRGPGRGWIVDRAGGGGVP